MFLSTVVNVELSRWIDRFHGSTYNRRHQFSRRFCTGSQVTMTTARFPIRCCFSITFNGKVPRYSCFHDCMERVNRCFVSLKGYVRWWLKSTIRPISCSLRHTPDSTPPSTSLLLFKQDLSSTSVKLRNTRTDPFLLASKNY